MKIQNIYDLIEELGNEKVEELMTEYFLIQKFKAKKYDELANDETDSEDNPILNYIQ